jgi:hypothetical protein
MSNLNHPEQRLAMQRSDNSRIGERGLPEGHDAIEVAHTLDDEAASISANSV